MSNIRKKFFFILVISLLTTGCAGLGERGGFLDGLDKSAVSVLGQKRLYLLGLDSRERQLLETYLQQTIGLNQQTTEYRSIFPRNDGSKLVTEVLVGQEFIPQTPVGLHCKGLKLRITLQSLEALLGEDSMCLDLLKKNPVWERYPNVTAPVQSTYLPSVFVNKAAEIPQPKKVIKHRRVKKTKK